MKSFWNDEMEDTNDSLIIEDNINSEWEHLSEFDDASDSFDNDWMQHKLGFKYFCFMFLKGDTCNNHGYTSLCMDFYQGGVTLSACDSICVSITFIAQQNVRKPDQKNFQNCPKILRREMFINLCLWTFLCT